MATMLNDCEFPVTVNDGVMEPAKGCTYSSSASLACVSAASRMKLPPGVTVDSVFPRSALPSPIIVATTRSPEAEVVMLQEIDVVWFVQLSSAGELVAIPEYSITAPCQSATAEE